MPVTSNTLGPSCDQGSSAVCQSGHALQSLMDRKVQKHGVVVMLEGLLHGNTPCQTMTHIHDMQGGGCLIVDDGTSICFVPRTTTICTQPAKQTLKNVPISIGMQKMHANAVLLQQISRAWQESTPPCHNLLCTICQAASSATHQPPQHPTGGRRMPGIMAGANLLLQSIHSIITTVGMCMHNCSACSRIGRFSSETHARAVAHPRCLATMPDGKPNHARWQTQRQH